MNKKAHGYTVHILIGLIVIGILLGINFYMGQQQQPYFIPLTMPQYAFILLITIIYSQMPDIDSQISIINKNFVSASLILIIVSFLYGWTEVGIAAAIILLVLEWTTHRGVIHTAMAGFALALPLAYFSWLYFAVGFLAHNIHLLAEGEWSLFTGKGLI
jgi:hypothetical protein